MNEDALKREYERRRIAHEWYQRVRQAARSVGKDELPSRIPGSEAMTDEEIDIFMANNRPVGPLLQGGMVKMLMDYCPSFNRTGTLLDIGCGTGEVSIVLSVAFPGLRVVGADLSARSVYEAQRLAKKLSLANPPEFIQAHFPRDLGRRFDTVFARSTLHHFAQGTDFWRTVAGHVKEDGAILVYDLSRPLTRDVAAAYVGVSVPPDCSQNRMMYLSSLLAAHRPAEVRKQAGETGLNLRVKNDGGMHFIAYRDAERESLWEN